MFIMIWLSFKWLFIDFAKMYLSYMSKNVHKKRSTYNKIIKNKSLN